VPEQLAEEFLWSERGRPNKLEEPGPLAVRAGTLAPNIPASVGDGRLDAEALGDLLRVEVLAVERQSHLGFVHKAADLANHGGRVQRLHKGRTLWSSPSLTP
jgi:hypothetical protein